MSPMILAAGIAAVVAVVVLIAFVRSGAFLKNLLFSSVSGLFGLGVTYAVGLFTGPLVVISPLSVAFGVLLGLPGVISLLIINLVL